MKTAQYRELEKLKNLVAKVVSVHVGSTDDLGKVKCSSLHAELDGFVGDRHRSYSRETWKGDKQPEGTKRRNERQWSAVSVEELADIGEVMGLKDPLRAASVGANICLEGISQLSRLPKGTLLKFPSGAELMVEEYNPPCMEMSQKIAATYTLVSGKPIQDTAFSKAAQLNRGLVGIIEVEGTIQIGDTVNIELYEHPEWLSVESRISEQIYES